MNYYQVLGVDNNAEQIIIRAAYKTLIQKYHPDKAKTPHETKEFLIRAKEINEAYSVLSDIKLRSEYDEKIKSSSSSSGTENNKDEWNSVVIYFPELIDLYNELNSISNQLGDEFKSNILRSKDFKNSIKIYEKLRENYFIKMFGNKKENLEFGKWLIMRNKKQYATEFNRIINLLGSDVDYNKIIYDFSRKNDIEYGAYKKEKDKARSENHIYEDSSYDPIKTLQPTSFNSIFKFIKAISHMIGFAVLFFILFSILIVLVFNVVSFSTS